MAFALLYSIRDAAGGSGVGELAVFLSCYAVTFLFQTRVADGLLRGSRASPSPDEPLGLDRFPRGMPWIGAAVRNADLAQAESPSRMPEAIH